MNSRGCFGTRITVVNINCDRRSLCCDTNEANEVISLLFRDFDKFLLTSVPFVEVLNKVEIENNFNFVSFKMVGVFKKLKIDNWKWIVQGV